MDPRPHTDVVHVSCPKSNGAFYPVPYGYALNGRDRIPLGVNICDHGCGDKCCSTCCEVVLSLLIGTEHPESSRYMIKV